MPTAPVVDRRVGERRAQARPPVRLLLVDDHPMFVASLHRVLEEEPDLSVVADAGTLAEAERESAAQAPDVILLDQRLPDGLGIRHVPALQAANPVSKIIILTATDEDRVLLAAIEAGCAGFVSKSSDLDELLGAVRAVAAGEVHMPPVLLRRLLPRLRRAGGGAPSALTPRELEVLRLIADGLSNAAIAARLTVSVHTVRNHVQNLLAKLGAHSKLEALAIAVREGMLDAP